MKKTLVLSLATFILFATSCSKSATQKEPPKQATTVNPANTSYLAYLVAFVIIVIKTTEGQYSKEEKANGTVIEKCDGLGTCAMSGKVVSTDEDLSSTDNYVLDDIAHNCFIGKTTDGRIILGGKKDGTNDEEIDNLFYDISINISRPFNINNPNVISELGLPVGSTIEVLGDYDVFSEDTDNNGTLDTKYIVIQD